jgi:ribonuclease-3
LQVHDPDNRANSVRGPKNKQDCEDLSSTAKSSSHINFAQLVKALDETIEECLQNGSTQVDSDSLQQCIQLQAHFRKSKNLQKAPSSLQNGLTASTIPKSLPSTLVTPWNSAEIPKSLPTLPAILDETLEKATFTHTNTGSGKLTDLNYEQLEWVGDAYMELTATLLISQTFPTLTPGKSSQLRERLVKNLQLSEYSRAYGFDKRANFGQNFIVKDKEKMTKILGDIFEAYVAAVILSDPINGLTKAVKWLRDLWSMTIRKEIVYQESSGLKYSSPMWNLERKPEDAISQPMVLNPKDQLQKSLGAKGVKISYRDTAKTAKCRDTKLPIFTVGVFLNGWGERDKKLGEGAANGKKEAGFKAAEQALKNKKLMIPLMEKKKLHDEQRELEKLALEKAQSL